MNFRDIQELKECTSNGVVFKSVLCNVPALLELFQKIAASVDEFQTTHASKEVKRPTAATLQFGASAVANDEEQETNNADADESAESVLETKQLFSTPFIVANKKSPTTHCDLVVPCLKRWQGDVRKLVQQWHTECTSTLHEGKVLELSTYKRSRFPSPSSTPNKNADGVANSSPRRGKKRTHQEITEDVADNGNNATTTTTTTTTENADSSVAPMATNCANEVQQQVAEPPLKASTTVTVSTQ